MDFLDSLSPLAPLALEATKYALKKSSSSATELATAATANDSKLVKSLLTKDLYIDRGPALVAAASEGNLAVLDVLLEPIPPSHAHEGHHHHEPQKVDLNVWAAGNTPLLAAVKDKHCKTTKLLLESGADPDLCPKTGITALQDAAHFGQIDIIGELLSFGADVNHQNEAGDTALIIASRWGHARTAGYLLEKGAKIDLRNSKGSTALGVAAGHGSVEVVEVLLKEGANVRVKDNKGRTPLHRAVQGTWLIDGLVGGSPESVKIEIVRMLLRAGANPNSRDADGKTPAERVSWFTGGEGLRRLLERRRSSWEGSPRDRQTRSRTF